MEEQMSVKSLLENLGELDQELADLFSLALLYGRNGDALTKGMLQRKLEILIGDIEGDACCCGDCLDDYNNDYSDDELGFTDEDDECDDDCDCELCEEPEPDELSDILRVDVNSASPIQLAVAIVMKSQGDKAKESSLIRKVSERGKSLAQLSTLVDGL
jgi:hypothetical protein